MRGRTLVAVAEQHDASTCMICQAIAGLSALAGGAAVNEYLRRRSVRALPVGPEGKEIAAWRAWPQAVGHWLRLEAGWADEIGAHLADRVTRLEASGWAITGLPSAPLGYYHAWDIEHPERWATVRIRMSVEVLDGVL